MNGSTGVFSPDRRPSPTDALAVNAVTNALAHSGANGDVKRPWPATR